MDLFTQNADNQPLTEINSTITSDINTDNQVVTVLYNNDQRTPFTLYCSHIGYIKGFNRVVDVLSYLASENYSKWLELTSNYLGEDIKKTKMQVIEHLEEHGKKDKIIMTFKPLDILKTRYDNN